MADIQTADARGAENGARLRTDAFLEELLEARKAVRGSPPYQPLSLDEVVAACHEITPLIGDNLAFAGVTRLGGGGSKEQFVLTATDASGAQRKYVVRTDPLEAVTVSGREREAEIMTYAGQHMPVPKVVLVDPGARYFRQPTMVMEFAEGVTKPSVAAAGVTGLGVVLGDPHRGRLAPQFLDYLVTLHGLDPTAGALAHHEIPRAGTNEASLWQAGFWSEVWAQDGVEPVPMITLAREWLLANAPVTARPSIVHGDYRTGNFLFDEPTGRITSVLDWELAHIGDYHEDVAHVLSPAALIFDGKWRANDLFERGEWLDRYQEASGNPVDRATLHYYEVLTAFKTYVAVVGTATSVANAGHSHQNVLLTTLPALGPGILAQLCDLIEAA